MRLGIILKKLNQWKMSAGGAHIYIIGYMASGSQLLLHFTKLNQKKMVVRAHILLATQNHFTKMNQEMNGGARTYI